MSAPPRPQIYHIVHVDNLASIIGDGFLWSDSIMFERQAVKIIGIGEIEKRRMTLPVYCHCGTCVADYVPFYFCPRSVMLYVIYRANHPELAYRGGQEPIVHLEADLHEVVRWAEANQRRWAFSLSNAGAAYAPFRARLEELNEVNWEAVKATDFRSADIMEGKQAEFLVENNFPWRLVRRIGVFSINVGQRTTNTIKAAAHRPIVEVQKEWYY